MTERKWNLLLGGGLLLALLVAVGAEWVTRSGAPEMTVYYAQDSETEVTQMTAAAELTQPPLRITNTTTAAASETTTTAAETKPLNRNLNTAGAEDLMRVPGIGEQLAAAILRYRELHGGFRRRAELCEISGIGETLMNAVMSEFEIPDELPPEPDAPAQTEAQITPQPAESTETQTEPLPQGPFEMNRVTREELLTIPGMTESLADAYLTLRGNLRGYANINELILIPEMDGAYAEQVLRVWLYLDDDAASHP